MSGNPYEYLKHECHEDVSPVEAQKEMTVTDNREETITIYTSELDDGSWVYGYMVYWANGRQSMLRPSAEQGKFRSEREARLYAVGFMLQYQGYFTSSTRDSLRRAESKLMQTELF